MIRKNPREPRIVKTVHGFTDRMRTRPGVVVRSGAVVSSPSEPALPFVTPASSGPSSGVMFLNHQQPRCGVYQMGRRIGVALATAGAAHYVEAPQFADAMSAVHRLRPALIVYNWHPSTIPWTPELIRRLPALTHVGLMHEISPEDPSAASDLFRYRVVSDPSFPTNEQTLFRVVRHVPRHPRSQNRNEVLTIGSFGFAVGGKMFGEVIQAVGKEFPGALVRLRLPAAHYGDDAGDLARQTADGCRAAALASSVALQIEHGFLDEPQLLEWLGANDMNVFFYAANGGRGVSSVLDYAIAAQRPIAINDSLMFRHIKGRLGCYPNVSLLESFAHSGSHVADFYDAWSPDRLVSDFRQIFTKLGVPAAALSR